MTETPGPLDLKTGVIEIGILISTFLYGITTVQAYIYFRESTRDPRWLRIMVAIVWILETFITIVTCMYLYRLTVTNFGKYETLQDLPWTLDFSFFIGGLVSAMVQSFFAYRVHVISGRWFVSVVAWSGSTVRVGVTLMIFILTLKSGTLVLYEEKYPWSIILSLVVAMFIDVLNTCSLCYYLHKMRTIFKGTNTLIDRVMTWSIETGLLTSICAILMLILELTKPEWNVWFGILMFYVKLYSNSLLLFLNGRSSLRGSGAISSLASSHLPRPHTVINVSQVTVGVLIPGALSIPLMRKLPFKTTDVPLEMGNLKSRHGEGTRMDGLQPDGRIFNWKRFSESNPSLPTSKPQLEKRAPDVLDEGTP